MLTNFRVDLDDIDHSSLTQFFYFICCHFIYFLFIYSINTIDVNHFYQSIRFLGKVIFVVANIDITPTGAGVGAGVVARLRSVPKMAELGDST
jgi:hypothetical protein